MAQEMGCHLNVPVANSKQQVAVSSIGPALNSSSPILSPANFRLAPAEKLYSTDLTNAE